MSQQKNSILDSHQAEIREAIKQLHKRDSGDYQSLMRQVNKAHRPIRLNAMQMCVRLFAKKRTMVVAGRGAGKTTLRGERRTTYLKEMPRSVGAFICPSYEKALTDILPSLTAGLEMFGLYEDLHYFVGKQPPRAWRKSWGRAYQEPKKYDKFISYWNGTRERIISHTIANDGVGTNTDWLDGDEHLYLDPFKLQKNTGATLRGTKGKVFEKCKFWGSEFYTGSMPVTQRGMWVLEWEAKARAYPDEYIYFSFPSIVNAENLMPGYIEAGRKNADNHALYLAEYWNIKPNISKGGFYGMLNEAVHGYQPEQDFQGYHGVQLHKDCRADNDCDPSKALLLGMDFGSDINCLSVLQLSDDQEELRAINAMYVLEPKLQQDLIMDFINYYKFHRKKVVKLWYDNTGNNKTGFTKHNRAQIAAKQLREAGWQVQLMTKGGSNPFHEKKHAVWEHMLNEGETRNARFPRFRINMLRCATLFKAMFHAKTKLDRNGKTKKDKTSEGRRATVKPQDATHFTDAIDSAVFGLYRSKLYNVGGVIGR